MQMHTQGFCVMAPLPWLLGDRAGPCPRFQASWHCVLWVQLCLPEWECLKAALCASESFSPSPDALPDAPPPRIRGG